MPEEEVSHVQCRQVGPYIIYSREPRVPGVHKYLVKKDGVYLRDFGRYTVAIRWCLSQLPRHKAYAVICINDDHKVSVVSTIPMGFTVLEEGADQGGDDLDGSVSIPPHLFHGGDMGTHGSVRYYHYNDRAVVNPQRIEEILKVTNTTP